MSLPIKEQSQKNVLTAQRIKETEENVMDFGIVTCDHNLL